jgi:predicted glycosyltransferase
MTERLDDARILIYSHDTFGLGHLRRCRAIAHDLVDRYKGLSVLILSGSPIIGSFDFRARVDFIRIPGVIKLHNGEYTSLGLHIDLEHTLALRSSIIHHTADIFSPDLFLVDKEPLGLHGEVGETLAMLKARGVYNILGLRDVMDGPDELKAEWDRKKAMPALRDLYNEIWIYGTPLMGDTFRGINVQPEVLDKTIYTGYLPRFVPRESSLRPPVVLEEPYILITAGGGGDGALLIDWVLCAYEKDSTLDRRAMIVLGPFMPASEQSDFIERIERLQKVSVITFDSHIEVLMSHAEGIVAMGGYNTFCEILSMDKRALLVPRSTPRKEQLIRAMQAQKLGLVKMLDGDGPRCWEDMAHSLRTLHHQPLPSEAAIDGLLDGLINVHNRIEHLFEKGHEADRLVAQRGV